MTFIRLYCDYLVRFYLPYNTISSRRAETISVLFIVLIPRAQYSIWHKGSAQYVRMFEYINEGMRALQCKMTLG